MKIELTMDVNKGSGVDLGYAVDHTGLDPAAADRVKQNVLDGIAALQSPITPVEFVLSTDGTEILRTTVNVPQGAAATAFRAGQELMSQLEFDAKVKAGQ